jgi:hypothetical protein
MQLLMCCYQKEIGKKRKTLKILFDSSNSLSNDANQPSCTSEGTTFKEAET